MQFFLPRKDVIPPYAEGWNSLLPQKDEILPLRATMEFPRSAEVRDPFLLLLPSREEGIPCFFPRRKESFRARKESLPSAEGLVLTYALSHLVQGAGDLGVSHCAAVVE